MEGSFYRAYIGTNSVRGSKGIYGVRVDADTLEPEITGICQSYNSGSLALSGDGRKLYAAVEGMTFEGYADGGVAGFLTDSGGGIVRTGGQRTYGQRTCCVALDPEDSHVYACNFYKGTMTAFPLSKEGELLPPEYVIEPPKEAFGHKALHCVGVIQNRYVGVISLAECALVIYRKENGERVCSYEFPGRPFPRYFAAEGRYIYAMLQNPDDIYVFESHLEEGDGIRLIQKISVMESGYSGMRATSAIRITPDGRLLLAANRPSDSITVFWRQENGMLKRSSLVTLPGNWPRDFHISQDGEIVVTALQKSDEICVHKIDYASGTLIPGAKKLSVPSPASVAVSRRCADE